MVVFYGAYLGVDVNEEGHVRVWFEAPAGHIAGSTVSCVKREDAIGALELHVEHCLDAIRHLRAWQPTRTQEEAPSATRGGDAR